MGLCRDIEGHIQRERERSERDRFYKVEVIQGLRRGPDIEDPTLNPKPPFWGEMYIGPLAYGTLSWSSVTLAGLGRSRLLWALWWLFWAEGVEFDCLGL